MSLRRQKKGSRSSSKHSVKAWSGVLASRCGLTCGSSWYHRLDPERGAQAGGLGSCPVEWWTLSDPS
jgi:hypothetical protein